MSGKELGFFVLVIGGWFLLNRWILPAFGVPTCMSGRCGWEPPPAAVGVSEAAPSRDEPVAVDARTDHERPPERAVEASNSGAQPGVGDNDRN